MEIKEPVNVLLVDDQPAKLLSYEVMLGELGENLIPVNSAQDALAFLLKSEVAVILVDVCMPELDGFELAKMIREHPRFQKTAIIFVSAVHMSESDYLRGYEAGAVDYLSVPVVPELLRAKVKVFAELFRKTRQLHSLNQELESRVAERTQALEQVAAGLRQSERGRTLALAAGNMGSWDYDLKADQWFWDEGQSRIFGVDHAGYVPTLEKVKKAIHPEDLTAAFEALHSLKPGEESVELELRILSPAGDAKWCHVAAVGSFGEGDRLVRISGVTTDITFRKEAEARQALLAREVDHRAKNTLAVVQALVRLARRESIDDYVKALEGRIGALAQTHELLSKARWEGADLLHLILEELAPYNDGMQRVTAVGPALLLSPEDTQLLAMALHELATNAAKYGALSSVNGRVDVSWSHFEGRLTLNWRESGGPAVSVPGKTGFGTRIIHSSFRGARRGDAQFDWDTGGLHCTLMLDCVVKQPAAQQTKEIVQAGERALSELRVPAAKARLLLVEDEAVVGMFMEELLQGLGFETIGPVPSLAESLAVAKRETFDAAILDMNLRGESVYPLADLLMARSVPFIFVTGYSKAGVESRFAGINIVEKPATHEALQKALNGLFAPPAAAGPSVGRQSRAAL